MWPLLLAAALAATPRCPAPEPLAALDTDTGPDDAEYQLVATPSVVCWWVIDSLGTPRIAHRWSRSDRHPVRIEALPDGRAALVMSDGRVQVRNVDDDRYRNLDVSVPGEPAVVIAHSRRDWLAITVPRDAESTLVMLLDLDRDRVLASVALPSHDLALSFIDSEDALWLDGGHALALTETGLSVRGPLPQ